MKTVTVIAIGALVALPVGYAQVIEGDVSIFAFHPDAFTATLIVDWYGVGGTSSEGSGFVTGDLPGNADEAPDSCLDQDNQGMVWGNAFYYIPSLGLRLVHEEEGVLVPGSSAPAPDALTGLCSQVRSLLFGQPEGFVYADDPQSVGVGDVNFEASAFALSAAEFDGALRADPASLEALLCSVDLATFEGTAPSEDGSEEWGGTGFDNGVLLATASGCVDVADDVRSYLVDDNALEPGQWDSGSINQEGNVVLWDMDLYVYDRTAGLHALCYKADVADAANAIVGFVEDYAYFWVDGPENAFALAPLWAIPTNSDGEAHAQDCAGIGIPL
ncbi:MAG: hypothetical protein ACRDH5_05135 [bacterium]